LFVEIESRMALFEFKNYDALDIGDEEVDQTRNYLINPVGRLSIIFCSNPPVDSMNRQRNKKYTNDKRVIIFIIKDSLKEMLANKERGE